MTAELLRQTYGQNIIVQPDGFWDYERLIGLPVNRSPDIGTRLDWSQISPFYKFACFQDDDWLKMAQKLSRSFLNQYAQVLMTIQPSVPIIAMTPAFFWSNLDDLMFYSRYSALVWTDDSTCVLECSRHNAVLYSTFPVS